MADETVRHSGGNVGVSAGVGVSAAGDFSALVRLVVEPEGRPRSEILLRPREARAIGLDLIGAAHHALADVVIRATARTHGLDGDTIEFLLRGLAEKEFG